MNPTTFGRLPIYAKFRVVDFRGRLLKTVYIKTENRTKMSGPHKHSACPYSSSPYGNGETLGGRAFFWFGKKLKVVRVHYGGGR